MEDHSKGMLFYRGEHKEESSVMAKGMTQKRKQMTQCHLRAAPGSYALQTEQERLSVTFLFPFAEGSS